MQSSSTVFNNVKRKSCTNWKTFLNKGKENFLQLHWICKMTAVFSGIVNIPHRTSLWWQPDKLTSSTEFKLFFQHTLNIHASVTKVLNDISLQIILKKFLLLLLGFSPGKKLYALCIYPNIFRILVSEVVLPFCCLTIQAEVLLS